MEDNQESEAEVLARGLAEALARVAALEERVSRVEDEQTGLMVSARLGRDLENDTAAALHRAAETREQKAQVAP